MFKRDILEVVFLSVFMAASVAHAGKAELTTYYPSPYGEYTNLTVTGNVGIGTTAPTVQFERACPSGFTNIKAGNNQLGCMQTAEAGSGTWAVATDYCFDNYGGRLPTNGEWYIAMANYALTDEIDDWERNNDAYPGEVHMRAGLGAITTLTQTPDSTAEVFRCWIPK